MDHMGNNTVGAPSAGVTASASESTSPLRYIPATLASIFVLAVLLGTGAYRYAEPLFYGVFLKQKGEPPVSTGTLLVTSDPGAGAMDAATLARLAAAILERGPAVVALGPSDAADPSALESLESGDAIPAGPLVLSHTFGGFRPWTVSDGPIPYHPPLLSHSLYPLLDGPEPGLALSQGMGMEIADSSISRNVRGSAVRQITTGFAFPLTGSGVFSVPAFARLDRGVTAALGIEAARRALGVAASKVGYVEGVGVLFDGSHLLPIDARGEIPMRFHGGGGIPRIAASRFLEGRVSAVEVQGKMVFVDPSAPGRPVIRSVAGPRTPVEIQASLASNFLEGNLISAPGWGRALPVIAGILFAAGIVLVLVLDFGAVGSFLLAAILIAAYPVLSLVLFLKYSWWLPPELPPLMVLAAYLPFAATRAMGPARRRQPQSIHPRPGNDPSLVSMPPLGRPVPGPQFQTPPMGMPQVQPFNSAPQTRQPSAAAATPPHTPHMLQTPIPPHPNQNIQGFQGVQEQGAPYGNAGHAGHARLPTHPQPQARPRPPAPKERQGAGAMAADAHMPIHPQPAPQPQAPHAKAAGDDIERDAKGGLVRVGKYRIVRKMGFGSAGDVFEGFDTHMGRKVAIKTITKNAAAHFDRASERFVLEAKAAGSLNHPCINTIYDFGTIRDVSYMVLEFLDGITLSQWMRGNPTPPRPAAVNHWLQQICSALDYAHGAKIIHRDLKPSNLMVVNNGATIKLLDFGIAKMEDVGLTQTGMTVGTPSYMSPEQLSGIRVGPGSDQYGLAVVIYQLFTYKLPYIGTKIPELCNRILKNDLIPITDANPSLGAPFWEALKKAMAKNPEERYPNCLALYAALEAAFPNP